MLERGVRTKGIPETQTHPPFLESASINDK